MKRMFVFGLRITDYPTCRLQVFCHRWVKTADVEVTLNL